MGGTKKKRRNDEEQIRTTQRHICNPTEAQTKNCNRGIALERSVGITLGREGAGMGVGQECKGLKPVLFARNLTFNSDAAPNYKYMVNPHRGPLPLTHL